MKYVCSYQNKLYICISNQANNNLKNNKMTTLTSLTAEQTKRVNNDLLDTQRMLNKELAYSKDLQNTNRIDQLEAHVVKLNGMILNGWNAPKFK